MNKLFTKIAALFLGMTMAVGVGVAVGTSSKASEVKAEDVVAYTLTPASGSNNSYASNCDIAIGGITWNLTGNSTIQPWRIGGKSLSGVDRTLYSKTAISDDVTKIEVTHGAASSITVNSWTLVVSQSADFSNPVSTLTPIFAASETTTINRPDGKSWANCYFKFTYNVTVSGSSNKFVEFSEAKFYKNGDTPTTTYKVTYNKNASDATGSMSDTTIDSSGNVTLDACTFTRPGYEFAGWATSETGAIAYADGASITGLTADLPLFAKWTEVIPTGMAISSSVSTLTPSGDNYIVNLVKGAKTGENDNVYDDDLLATVTPTNALDKTLTWTKTDPSSLIGTWFPGGSELMFDFSTENKGSFVITATTTKGNVIRTVTYNIADKFDISTTITGGSVSGDGFILEGGNASITITPDDTHKMPSESDITVTGATSSYSDGVITLSNPTENVTIGINCPALTPYSITVNASNATVVAEETILETKTSIVLFEPDTGYGQPNDVAVDGATKDWDKASGTLTLSNPTKNVTVTYEAAENELSSISLNPASKNYVLGEDFAMPEVTANYTVAASKVVSGATKQPTEFDPFTLGPQVFTISYTEGGITKTAEYTANVQTKELPTTSTWVETSITALTSGDKFVIVGDNGNSYAMSNDGGTSSAPSAVAVTVKEGEITSEIADNIKWSISGNATDGYTFYPNGSTETWLYCISNNNGLRVGDSSNNTFEIKDDYLYNKGQERYVGIYNSQDWRSYTSINNNIKDQTFAFYKEVKTPVGTGDLIRITAEYTAETKAIGDTVEPTDFLVKKQLNTSESLDTIENSTGVTITSGATLSGESNDVTLSYTEGNITKSTTVSVPAISTPTIELDKLSFAGSSDDEVIYSLTATVRNITTPVYDWSVTGEDTDAIDLTSSENSGTATFTMVKGGSCSISVYASESGDDTKYTPTVSATVSVTQSGLDGVTITNGEEGYVYAGKTFQLGYTLDNPTGAAVDSGVTWSTSDSEYATVNENGLITGVAQGTATITVTSKFDTSKEDTFKIIVVGQINSIIHTETITPAWEETIKGYEKVLSTADITSDDRYLIVYEDGDNSLAFDGSLTTLDASRNTLGVEISDNFIDVSNQATNPFAGSEFTIDKTAGSIKSKSGYYIGNNSDSNALSSSDTTVYANTISIDTSENLVVQSSGGAYLRYNSTSGQERFRYYKSSTYTSQKPIALYKYVEETIEHPAVTEDVEYANIEGMEKAQLAVITYAQAINIEMIQTNVCSGDHSMMSNAWGKVKEMYEFLFVDNANNLSPTELAHAKNMLKYVHGNWSGSNFPTLVEHAMKTYDVCVKTYGMENFMMDGEDPLRTPVQDVNPISIFGTTENSNMVAIVVIVSVVSLTAIGGYFFLKKRREQN